MSNLNLDMKQTQCIDQLVQGTTLYMVKLE